MGNHQRRSLFNSLLEEFIERTNKIDQRNAEKNRKASVVTTKMTTWPTFCVDIVVFMSNLETISRLKPMKSKLKRLMSLDYRKGCFETVKSASEHHCRCEKGVAEVCVTDS